MVLTAFRGPNSIGVASSAVVPQGNGVHAQVQDNGSSFDPSLVAAPALFEMTAGDVTPFDNDLRPPIPFDAPDAGRFDFYRDEDPVDRVPTLRSDSSPLSPENGSQQGEKLFEGFVHSVSLANPEYARVDANVDIQPASIIEAPVESGYDGNDSVEEREAAAALPEEDVKADPWATPLAAWDYSQSEWPVLVGPTSRKTFTKFIGAIAVVVVLASVAAFYFLVYQPSNPVSSAATDTGTATNVSTGESGRSAGSSADSAAQGATQTQSNKTAAVTPSEAAAADNGVAAQGQFSLQAASFPNQDGADEFAEKVKRAGLPSYVVPAELARRGKWFRVRVGRFNTAENAQRFAGEAQQRARAAGLALQLIVCQYDQP